MANSTHTPDLSRVSRSLSRRADARPAIIAALVAVVVFLSALGSALPRFDGSSHDWNDARLVQARPSVHSLAAHPDDHARRTQRRPSPHFDVPLASDASQSAWLTSISTIALSATRLHRITAVALRGYDATAPPVS
jgi:hypothetical protein